MVRGAILLIDKGRLLIYNGIVNKNKTVEDRNMGIWNGLKGKFRVVRARKQGLVMPKNYEEVFDEDVSDTDRFHAVKGKMGVLPTPFSYNEIGDGKVISASWTDERKSITYFTDDGMVCVLTQHGGEVVWEDLSCLSNTRVIKFMVNPIESAPVVGEGGKIVGSKIVCHKGPSEYIIDTGILRGYFEGDIRKHLYPKAELISKILCAVNLPDANGKAVEAEVLQGETPAPILHFAHAMDGGAHIVRQAKGEDKISINKHPSQLIVPCCFELIDIEEDDRYMIGHLSATGQYVEYELTGYGAASTPAEDCQ